MPSPKGTLQQYGKLQIVTKAGGLISDTLQNITAKLNQGRTAVSAQLIEGLLLTLL